MALLIRASQAARNEGAGSVSAARSLHKSKRVVQLTGLEPLIFGENAITP